MALHDSSNRYSAFVGSSRQQRRRPRARHVATRRPRGRFDGTERWRRCAMRGRRLGELYKSTVVADTADQSSSTSCSRRHHGNVVTACRDDHRLRSRAGKAALDHHHTRAEARQTMTTTMLSSWPSLVSSRFSFVKLTCRRGRVSALWSRPSDRRDPGPYRSRMPEA